MKTQKSNRVGISIPREIYNKLVAQKKLIGIPIAVQVKHALERECERLKI